MRWLIRRWQCFWRGYHVYEFNHFCHDCGRKVKLCHPIR